MMLSASIILLLIALVLLVLTTWLIKKGRAANEVDWGNNTVNVLDGLMRLYCRRFHRLEHHDLTLPKAGGAVVLSNHITGVDPFLLLTACKRPLRFMIATEEYRRPILNRLFKAVGCIPVDRTSKPEQAFRVAIKKIREGEVVAVFPHGGFHLDDAPHKPIKKGGLRLASLSDSPIIPCRISGMKAMDTVFTALFVRSKAKLTTFPTISPEQIDKDTAKLIEDQLLGRSLDNQD